MSNDLFSKIEELLNQTQFDEALKIIENLEKKETLTQEDQLTCQLFKSQVLFKKGDHEEALQLAKTVLEVCTKLGNSLLELDTRLIMAEILEDLGIISRSFSKYMRDSSRFTNVNYCS